MVSIRVVSVAALALGCAWACGGGQASLGERTRSAGPDAASAAEVGPRRGPRVVSAEAREAADEAYRAGRALLFASAPVEAARALEASLAIWDHPWTRLLLAQSSFAAGHDVNAHVALWRLALDGAQVWPPTLGAHVATLPLLADMSWNWFVDVVVVEGVAGDVVVEHARPSLGAGDGHRWLGLVPEGPLRLRVRVAGRERVVELTVQGGKYTLIAFDDGDAPPTVVSRARLAEDLAAAQAWLLGQAVSLDAWAAARRREYEATPKPAPRPGAIVRAEVIDEHCAEPAGELAVVCEVARRELGPLVERLREAEARHAELLRRYTDQLKRAPPPESLLSGGPLSDVPPNPDR